MPKNYPQELILVPRSRLEDESLLDIPRIAWRWGVAEMTARRRLEQFRVPAICLSDNSRCYILPALIALNAEGESGASERLCPTSPRA
jgi:hypothetical protein